MDGARDLARGGVRTAARLERRGLELILPDWFCQSVLADAFVLTIRREYFGLTGGIERWLYRLARKHAGRQAEGWAFDFRHLHAKSGSLARFTNFAIDLRTAAQRQRLPGYRLAVERRPDGSERLRFLPRGPAEVPLTAAKVIHRHGG